MSFGGLRQVSRQVLRLDAFLTTVESTAARHKLPYISTRLANAAKVSTYTLQHSFENIGLTYSDGVHGPDVRYAAKTVMTWGRPEQIPARVAGETRRKCVAVGRPKRPLMVDNPRGPGVDTLPSGKRRLQIDAVTTMLSRSKGC